MNPILFKINTNYKPLIKNIFFAFAFAFLFLIISCKKESYNSGNYLISSSIQKSISVSQSNIILSVISLQYPELASSLENINLQYDIIVYRIVYKTVFKNNEIKASGVVCVPQSDKEFPIMSFQNGTNTKLANAPSVNVFNELFTFLECLAGNGYIIVIPDYIGFGESDQFLHPYYHRSSSDAAIIDLIKATSEFLQQGNTSAASNDQLFLLGYSQGGWATLSVLDSIEQSGTLTNEIVAVSCGAGAYNVYNAAKHIISLDTYPDPFYLPYFIESHVRNGFLNESLSKYFNEPYAARIPGLFNGYLSGSEINDQLTKNVDSLLTENMRNSFESSPDFASLRYELQKNSLVAWPTNTKILFIHGNADENVSPFESQNIYNDFLEAGVPEGQITLSMLEGKNHGSALLPWGVQTFLWFNSLKN